MVTEASTPLNCSRRSFLQKATQIVLGLGVVTAPTISCAKALGKRSLSFFHTHTQQQLDITYAWGKVYNQKALADINRFLRDYQTNQTHVMDPRLLDILWGIQGEMGRRGVYEVISGFRSPLTNKILRQTSSGVAGHSLHMQGKAIDVRFSGAQTNQVQQCAKEMRAGGVGYYAKADFVHLDTGQFRTW